MHRVNTRKQRAFILRIAAYALTLVLSVITTVLLLYVALGYRFDRDSGQVVRSGLLLVENRPKAASIYIDEVLRDNSAPGRFVLSAGKYALRLELEGYRRWQKTISISASAVRSVTYPILVPSELKSKSIGVIGKASVVGQTRDRKSLLVHGEGSDSLTLITFDEEKIEQKSLPLGDVITRQNGKIGTFNADEWSFDGKKLILQHILPDGTAELISFNINKSEDNINLTRTTGLTAQGDVRFANPSGSSVYGVNDGVLSRYLLKNDSNESEVILKNVRSYEPYGDDSVLFDRTNAEGGVEVGIWNDGVAKVVHMPEVGAQPSLLAYSSFDDHYYFTVASSNGNEVLVYRDPLMKNSKTKLSPFIELPFSQPQDIKFNGSGQFLLIQNGANITTYDFDDFKQYKTTVDFTPLATDDFSWLTSEHLMVRRQDGMNIMMDYDGENQQELVATGPGAKLYFNGSYEYAYHVVKADDGQARIEMTPFIVED